MGRVPDWWLTVGADTAQKLEIGFSNVMAELPIPQAALAEDLGVKPVTLWRWANGETTPPPEKMLEAVEKVRAHLERIDNRASLVQDALQLVMAAQESEEEEVAEGDEVEALRKMLRDKGA